VDSRANDGKTGDRDGPVTASAPEAPAVQTILGIRFFLGSAKEAIDYLSRVGGYVVVPSGPGLINLTDDEAYRTALIEADMAIADSGFMALLWRLMESAPITRISGLTYLKQLLEEPELRKPGQTYWIMPSKAADERAKAWLRSEGFSLGDDDTYLAPRYGQTVEDPELVRLLETKRPRHIIVGIGGGPQEKLGHYLTRNLSYRPAIHCIGAAIGFLTGDQVHIPTWADKLYLGWLFRSIAHPKVFVPRFWGARKLPGMMWRYRRQLPPIPPQKAEF
jgi:UDP-N-acetyl-D-mannosaminuronic acid transferase (WecB/TagA/CpsF family)